MKAHPLDALEPGEGKDLFETMLAHSTEARWYVVTMGLVATSVIPPTREELIADVMSIPVYTPYKDEKGHAQFGEPHYPTREEAQRKIGDYGLEDVAA